MLCALLAFLILAVPSASAQITETSQVLDSGETRVVQTAITENGDTTVTSERLIAADGCSETVTITTDTLVSNTEPAAPAGEYETRQGVSPLQPTGTLITTVVNEQNDLACVPPSPPLTSDLPDEVLGLAITGSNVDLPVAIGVALIGAGGLLVAATKKRRTDDA